ncbi:hypothetical protein ACP70R_017041 [Stipagrostis hirtigluma subsp. patula]
MQYNQIAAMEDIKQWWERIVGHGNKDRIQIAVYVVWNLWKESCFPGMRSGHGRDGPDCRRSAPRRQGGRAKAALRLQVRYLYGKEDGQRLSKIGMFELREGSGDVSCTVSVIHAAVVASFHIISRHARKKRRATENRASSRRVRQARTPPPAMDALPDDVLADVLSLLSPRSLAACRSVCGAWRAVVDARRLLRADLLPLSVRGIFLTMPTVATLPDFLPPAIDGAQDRIPPRLRRGRGLPVHPRLLQWPSPASRPAGMESFYYYDDEYLVFDPTVSPHYEVVLLPCVPYDLDPKSKFVEGSEWPPSPCIIQVYSSRIRRWEERLFVREGEAADNCRCAISLEFLPSLCGLLA